MANFLRLFAVREWAQVPDPARLADLWDPSQDAQIEQFYLHAKSWIVGNIPCQNSRLIRNSTAFDVQDRTVLDYIGQMNIQI
jgi:hypothetical protein